MKYQCKCGESFTNRRHLIEHIGICNPHWPRSSENDEHKEVKEVKLNRPGPHGNK